MVDWCFGKMEEAKKGVASHYSAQGNSRQGNPLVEKSSFNP